MRNFFTIQNAHALHPEIVKYFKRNFFVNVMDAGFWFFGDSFVAAYTILPVFMSTLTDSPLLIGLIPALEGAGWFLPQIFLARHLEGKSRRLPLVRALGALDRLPFLLLALSTFFISMMDTNLAIGLFLAIYGIKVFSGGLVALPWQELIATVIPVSHRGRYWGTALILGKLMGMIGAVLTGFLLVNFAYPVNYAYMFLIGFVCVMFSYVFLYMNFEPAIERQAPQEEIPIWGRITGILRADHNFGMYLVNRGFVFLSFMGLGFITVYGIQKFNLPLSYSAVFTGVMLVSEIVGYGIWGTVGDKMGYKRVIEYSNVFLSFKRT